MKWFSLQISAVILMLNWIHEITITSFWKQILQDCAKEWPLASLPLPFLFTCELFMDENTRFLRFWAPNRFQTMMKNLLHIQIFSSRSLSENKICFLCIYVDKNENLTKIATRPIPSSLPFITDANFFPPKIRLRFTDVSSEGQDEIMLEERGCWLMSACLNRGMAEENKRHSTH